LNQSTRADSVLESIRKLDRKSAKPNAAARRLARMRAKEYVHDLQGFIEKMM
jgi:hypothetical protein